MGRTRLAKAVASEIRERISISKQRKKELVNYLYKLQEAYSKSKISYAQYIETIYKKRDGRSINEWIEYYDNHIKDCEKKLKKQKNKIIANYLVLGFSLILVLFLASFLFDIRPTFVGFVTQEQEFTQTLNFETNESTNYEWVVENYGQLNSAKLSGLIEGNGEVKIYLEDLLILDSSKIKKVKGITGQAVSGDEGISSFFKKFFGFLGIIGRAVEEESPTPPPTEQSESYSDTQESESYSGELNQEVLKEDSSPSQEPPSPETNISEEEINETQTNQSYSEIKEAPLEDSSPSHEELPSSEKEITIREFTDWCEETCDLSELNLNKSSYILRIEISDANLKLNEIKYGVTPVEIPIEIPEGVIEVPEVNITIPENITEENITIIEKNVSANVSTLQYQAIINKPTKWIKTIKLKDINITNLTIELPKEAINISVKTDAEVQQALDELESYNTTISKADKRDFLSGAITGNVALDIKNDQGILTRLWNWFKRFTITGNIIEEQELKKDIIETSDKKIIDLEDIVNQTNATEIAVEYYTDGPTATEENISSGKRIVVSGKDELNYTDVLAFTSIPEKFSVGQEDRIKIYWREENKFVDFSAHDTNGNNKIDYVEWIVPHLSNQTFDIILITKAEHLDFNREFISDIYEEVKALDNIWSETINDFEYVRVTFEINLTSNRDITIYPRTVSGTPKIEVYEIDGTEVIAEFTSINSNEYNKIYLTNLQGNQDTFDLRVLDGNIEIDHIIDPTLIINAGNSPYELCGEITAYDIIVVESTGLLQVCPYNGTAETGYADISLGSNGNFTVESGGLVNLSGIGGYGGDPSIVTGSGNGADQGMNSTTQAGSQSTSANGGGGGGGQRNGGSAADGGGGGGFGGAGGIGEDAENGGNDVPGDGGGTYGAEDSMILSPGSGGGGGAGDAIGASALIGGRGGGGLMINVSAGSINIAGIINASGDAGGSGTTAVDTGAGGGGSGGHIILVGKDITISGTISASGGDGGNAGTSTSDACDGGGGGGGRIFIGYTNLDNSSATTESSGGAGDTGGGGKSCTTGGSGSGGTVYYTEMSFNSPPTTPTNITCDGSNNCNVSVTQGDIINLTGSGSNDTDGDDFNYTIEAALLNTTTSSDQELGTSQAIATGGGDVIGEAGNVTISGGAWQLIAFENNYASIPIVIATPASQNAGASEDESPLVTAISLVNETHLNITLCMDNGEPTCDPPSQDEILHYFVFDVDQLGNYDWIDGGTELNVASAVDTSSATLTFGASFAVAPYVFSSAVTYNQGSNIAQHQWYTPVSTSSATMFACTHQNGNGETTPAIDDCDSTSAAENVSWIAIDPSNHQIDGLQIGTESISDSAWTAITFSPPFTNPMIMVTQNSEGGGQDPQYPWARSVTTIGADISYCEADAADDCNTHNPENIRWFALENGDITVDGGASDTETTKNWETYTDVSSGWKNMTDLNVTVYVSVYNNSGSTQNGNNNPDLQLEVYNSYDFVHIGNFSVNGAGNFTLTVSEPTVLTGWQTSADTDLRIRGVNFDYNTSSYVDEINWTGVWININGARWIEIGNHSNATTLQWNTTNIAEQTCIDLRTRAIDLNGSASYSDYFTKGACLNITEAAVDTTYPEVNITTPINNTVITDTAQDINYTYTETNPDSCWYTNDTNSVNITLASCGTNITDLVWATGQHNVTIWINDTSNNVNSTYVNFTMTVANAAPTITQVWNGSSAITLNDGPSSTNLNFNFSVTDTNGISDLVNESVIINISQSGVGRINNTACAQYQASGNNANYTCNVTMWWFDSDGIWAINVSIKDSGNLWASNVSTNITINMVTGFVSGPGNLSFATLQPGTTNQTPPNWITINNTGNQDIDYNTFQINATNLRGEKISSQALWAGNFSVGNQTSAAKPECDSSNTTAQNLSASVYTIIAGAILPAGNFTENNNVTGQEVLYICIRTIGIELSQQQYSTSNEGAWTIKILLVAMSFRRRKKRKRKSKIPTQIFMQGVSPLEAISKYMKENLGLSYHEIAEELNRNERTIWTSYNNAIKKRKTKFVIEKDILISSEIFDDRRLSVLESIVVDLKSREMKYAEIAELLGKDQRNIWTVYSRAIKKVPILLDKEKIDKEKLKIPSSIFSRKLGALEALCKYMKENIGMKYSEIAKLLKRDERTIWASYNKAFSKQKNPLEIKETDIKLDISIFGNREFTILESVIVCLKKRGMKYSEIAELVDRDQRNVWTVYAKVINKINDNNNI